MSIESWLLIVYNVLEFSENILRVGTVSGLKATDKTPTAEMPLIEASMTFVVWV